VKKKSKIIGREREWSELSQAIALSRNILIEGPVGVGKTFLVAEILRNLDLEFERIDGDTRYTEQKLTGWFDPPIVLKKGYVDSAFVDGPLAIAMKKGRVLFINELNRMPEAVQNILLPAMDERRIALPKLGEIPAKPGFFVIATQNPREFTATHALSEALLDRFEMVHLDYQSAEDEFAIVRELTSAKVTDAQIERTVTLVRSTRTHAAIKRGASVRAAIAICKLMEGGMEFETAVKLALPSRMELISSDESPFELIQNLITLTPSGSALKKK
jgi:gas vesicle protein GvpN